MKLISHSVKLTALLSASLLYLNFSYAGSCTMHGFAGGINFYSPNSNLSVVSFFSEREKPDYKSSEYHLPTLKIAKVFRSDSGLRENQKIKLNLESRKYCLRRPLIESNKVYVIKKNDEGYALLTLDYNDLSFDSTRRLVHGRLYSKLSGDVESMSVENFVRMVNGEKLAPKGVRCSLIHQSEGLQSIIDLSFSPENDSGIISGRTVRNTYYAKSSSGKNRLINSYNDFATARMQNKEILSRWGRVLVGEEMVLGEASYNISVKVEKHSNEAITINLRHETPLWKYYENKDMGYEKLISYSLNLDLNESEYKTRTAINGFKCGVLFNNINYIPYEQYQLLYPND